MHFEFDKIINRLGTSSSKWNKYNRPEIIPMWVADMDFETAPCIKSALLDRINHGIYGYTEPPKELPSTVAQYLKTELKLKTIRNVTLGHIRSFVRKLSNRGLAANSIKRAVSSIRTYHNFLSAEGHMKDNPAQLLDTPKIPRKLPLVLNEKEISNIIKAIDDEYQFAKRDKAIVEMLY